MAAGQEHRSVGRLPAGCGAGAVAASLSLYRQRSRRRHPGQAPRQRGHHRSSDAADDPRRIARRPGAAGDAGRRICAGRRSRPEAGRRARRRHPVAGAGAAARCRRQCDARYADQRRPARARCASLRPQGNADPRRPACIRPRARRRPAQRSHRLDRAAAALGFEGAGCFAASGTCARSRPCRIRSARPAISPTISTDRVPQSLQGPAPRHGAHRATPSNGSNGSRSNWSPACSRATARGRGRAAVFDWINAKLRPVIDACGAAEIGAFLRGLDGRFVRPGPSGAPTRGRPDVLPTGRNFFAVDVRAVPTPSAWRIGQLAAERLVEGYWQEAGEWPRAIALSAWGTANMRTGGDDVAQALALIGARPLWEETSGRVTGFAITPLGELKRPRVDVTFRVSGLFRDAFPTQMDIIDSAVSAIAMLDEPEDSQSDRRQRPYPAQGARSRRYGRRSCATPGRVSRVRLEAGRLWRRPAGADRRGRLEYRARPCRCLSRLGRLRLWQRHRGRGRAGRFRRTPQGRRSGRADPGQPRARHPGFRRLLPVHGRSGGDRADLAGAGAARCRISTPRGRKRRCRGRSATRSPASCAAAPPIRNGSPA